MATIPYSEFEGDLNKAAAKTAKTTAAPAPASAKAPVKPRPPGIYSEPLKAIDSFERGVGDARDAVKTSAIKAGIAAGGIGDMAAGAFRKNVSGPSWDAGRQALAKIAGGDPATLPGGQHAGRDSGAAMLKQGQAQAGAVAEEVATVGREIKDEAQASLRDALGVKKAEPAKVAAPAAIGAGAAATNFVEKRAGTPSIASGITPAQSVAAMPATADDGKFRTYAKGDTEQNTIYGRRGADGSHEFTNIPGKGETAAGSYNPGSRAGKGSFSVVDNSEQRAQTRQFMDAAFARHAAAGDLDRMMLTADRNNPEHMAAIGQRERKGPSISYMRDPETDQRNASIRSPRKGVTKAEARAEELDNARQAINQGYEVEGWKRDNARAAVDVQAEQARNEKWKTSAEAAKADEERLALASERALQERQLDVMEQLRTETDPQRRQDLQDALLAMQGKNPTEGRVIAVNGPVTTDAMGNKIQGPGAVYDQRSGQFITQDNQKPSIREDAKAQEIRAKAQSGEITREQAIAELQKMGYRA